MGTPQGGRGDSPAWARVAEGTALPRPEGQRGQSCPGHGDRRDRGHPLHGEQSEHRAELRKAAVGAWAVQGCGHLLYFQTGTEMKSGAGIQAGMEIMS